MRTQTALCPNYFLVNAWNIFTQQDWNYSSDQVFIWPISDTDLISASDQVIFHHKILKTRDDFFNLFGKTLS